MKFILMDASGRDMLSLERVENGLFTKSDIFDHPVSFSLDEVSHVDSPEEALTDCLELAEVMREIQVTRDKVEEIDDVLAQMDEDDARILRLWYIERKSKDEITEAVCYSSTSSLYDLRNKALVRFALLYFGAGAMTSM